MSREQALNQSLASCGAVIIAFVGIVHEAAGHLLFPWAPAFFGGPVGWHGMGILTLVTGLLLLGATLGLIRFPVLIPAAAIILGSTAITIFVAIVHGQLHLFAILLAAAAAVTAVFHRRATKSAR